MKGKKHQQPNTSKKELQTKNDIPQSVNNNQSLDQQVEFNKHYYRQYKRAYRTGLHLSAQMKQLVASRDQTWTQLTRLEEKTMEFRDIIRGEPREKKRRIRRDAEEINRGFQCPHSNCQKSYGTEGSLNQHLRLKHSQ